ncbi:hypothetical protein [Burkholderia anthina]|uniref:hypothetical protein n=1 Tax=Burkholderia anthina TaxID=179879 RepID=UPI00075AFEC5|nr:hypothetical protein [Burkholderia anthina]KVE07238.1 hypothetical protein WS65_14895 [Burkholderia anthina]
MHEALPWRFGGFVVIVPALAGFACLASVPFHATSPMKTPDDESRMFVARRMFPCGAGAVWCAIAASLFV